MTERRGPLTGIRAIEIAGLGAGPYAAMLLADLGADVIRVDRPGTKSTKPEKYALSRGRRSITIDMKKPEGLATLLTLVDKADVIFEGFRPGVAEKLGFGPQVCLERNPRLVYGRMTGWGQDGPMSQMAGHDLNYLGLTGALGMLARPGGQPASPPGFVADMGGGGLLLAFGLVCAVLESRTTGAGQVVDAAMIDGVASMTTLVHSMIAQGRWHDPPGSNFCDGGAPYYDSYQTSDGLYLAVAPIEPQFYAAMVDKLGLSLDALPDRDDPANWAGLKKLFAGIFRTRTRAEWTELFDGTDACVTPVLSFGEAVMHPHNVARKTFATAFGVTQPAPAPRFDGTPGGISSPPPLPGANSRAVLCDWGVSETDIDALVTAGVVVEAT
jgi:alpha-methylacyl-CoA racemase